MWSEVSRPRVDDGDVGAGSAVDLGPRELVTPVVAWAAGAWVAALVGWAAAPPVATRGVVVGGCVLGALVVAVWVVGRRRRGAGGGSGVPAVTARSLGATLVGLVLVVATAGTSAWWRAAALDAGPLADLARQGGSVAVRGTVASEPVQRPDGTAWTIVVVTRVEQRAGRWRALVSGLRDPPAVGTEVAATVTARPLEPDGFGSWLRRRHVGVEVSAGDDGWTTLRGPTGLLGWVERVRAAVRAAAQRGLDGDAAALAAGLVTGDTRGLSPETDDAMRATGLTHLVAVSGSNVALVLGVVAAVTGMASVAVRRGLLVAAVLVFTVTTRVEPSVLRAAVMAGMVLLARVRGVPVDAVHALAATLLVLVLLDPASAGSLGLVLSALATAGVLVVAPTVVARLPRRTPRPLGLLLAATLGAQAAVAPVLLATVGEVPLVSVPANLVAVPAAAVASGIAVVGAVVAQVHVGVASVAFALARPALAVVLATAAHLRGPVLSAARPLVLAGVVVAVGAGLARPGSRTRRRLLAGLVAGVLVVGATNVGPEVWTHGAPPAPGVLSVTAIDVGQGDSVLVTTASGHRMLVDVGGDDRAATWLRRHGVDRVDVLVLTHWHADHVGGLPAVLAATDVGVVWLAPAPGDPAGLPTTVPTTDGPIDLTPIEVPVVDVRAGMSADLGSARVEVLGPPDGWALVDTDGGRNDQSVVVRAAEGDRVALLTGDAELAAQHWLLGHATSVRAGLLKVPHHGAATTDPDFLEAVAPVVALVSVGVDNDYGHPAPALIGWLDDLDVEVHRTDRDGTVTVTVPSRPP